MASWLDIDPVSGFSLQNLPYCIYSSGEGGPRIGVAIGDYIADMSKLLHTGAFASIQTDLASLSEKTLNNYASLPKKVHLQVRSILQDLFSRQTTLGAFLRDNAERKADILVQHQKAQFHQPMQIGDYTDFFVTYYHASTCQRLFMSGGDLHPNYLSQPSGYHGRSSSIVVSGTPIRRPKGQFKVGDSIGFGPCQKLDYEVEFAAFIGQGNRMGESIAVNDAEDHIFGVVLLNDWSVRDIQMWESTPLGPFNGKNFATTISPFVVPLEALDPWRTSALKPRQHLPYLDQKDTSTVFDIPVDVQIEDSRGRRFTSQCNTKYVAFSFAQMLAHHTAGGCPMRPGDLIATGTLSGPEQHQAGCLLEMARNGQESLCSTKGEQTEKAFVDDGDIVTFKAFGTGKGELGSVGFGECSGRILSSQ